jgi:hypothetical protein
VCSRRHRVASHRAVVSWTDLVYSAGLFRTGREEGLPGDGSPAATV